MVEPTSSQTFRDLLQKLVQTPEHYTPDDIKVSLELLFTQDDLHPAQIGAFMTALHIHRVEARPESLAAAAKVLRARALKVAIEDMESDFVVDMVGTGGDGHNVFNVSTTAAIVAAGAGARVVKHGNRASTSSSGSADLLESLDCIFTPPTAGTPYTPRIPFTFIMAPHYHPTLASLVPYRKALPFRTIFNILGPLVNPARPQGMVLGVAQSDLGNTFAQCLGEDGVKRALVVCGFERLDEISCAGPTHVWELKDGKVTEFVLKPEDFGLPCHPLHTVVGGTPKENATTFKTLLMSGDKIPEQLVPILDFVLINASALLVVAGIAHDYIEGTKLARESIISGKAWKAFESFREAGNKVAQAAQV